MQTPSTDEQIGLTKADIDEIRRNADSDVFYFGRVICGHQDLVLEDHGPLMYAAAGQADKLIALLRSDLDSYTIKEFRRECSRFGINIKSPDAEARLAEHLRVIDLRVYRGSGKSSSLTHAVRLWKMVRYPNMSSALITNVEDPKAKDFCKQIRATILSELFAAVYPDRVPVDPKGSLTENRLTLAGRTIPDKEPCLMAFGHKTSPTGYHFDELQFDDLVGRENKSIIEIAEVRDFLSNVADLYNPGIRFPIRRIHVGTRWDEEDDAAHVRKYAPTLAITVPIWIRETPSDDITVQGVPTTQWKTLEAIIAKQEEVLSNPEEGALSWRCNNELDPAIGGGRIFSAQLVDNADWKPFRDVATTNGREWVMRPVFDKDGSRELSKDGTTPKSLAFDPELLFKITCCDQSFSDDGDEWAVGTVGMDQYGHTYELEMTADHGFEAMLDAILMHHATWKPMRIGMEKIAAQKAIEVLLNLDQRFRKIYSLIESVPHNNFSKVYRIRNFVAEVMKMRRHWGNPRDIETKQEKKKYKPGPNAKDNRLDVLAMCAVLAQKSLQPKEEEDGYKKKFAAQNRLNRERRDRYTGIALW